MDDRQPDDAVTDATLERDVEQALAVDPSPEFLARLREGIANESVSSGWGIPWRWVGAGSAIAAIAITMLMFRPATPRPGDLLAPRPVASKPAASPVASLPRAPGEQARIVRHRRSPAVTSGVVRTRRAEPEVLIAKDEAAALKRLMRGLRQGVVEPSTSGEQLTGIQAIRPPEPIVVLPIMAMLPVAIEPLRSPAREGGVRQ
jgi:hypothetical protein